MYKQAMGDALNYTCTGAVTNGSLVKAGVIIGVAATAGVTGDVIALHTDGQFADIIKDAGAGSNWAIGGRVYYMTTGGVHKLTGVATAGQLIGYGVAAATTGAVAGTFVLRNPPPLETQA